MPIPADNYLKYNCDENAASNVVRDDNDDAFNGVLQASATALAVNTSIAHVADGPNAATSCLECGAGALARYIAAWNSPPGSLPIHVSYWFKLPAGLPTGSVLVFTGLAMGASLTLIVLANGDVYFNSDGDATAPFGNIAATPTAWHNVQFWDSTSGSGDNQWASLDNGTPVAFRNSYKLENDYVYQFGNEALAERAVRIALINMYGVVLSAGQRTDLYQEGLTATGGANLKPHRMGIGISIP